MPFRFIDHTGRERTADGLASLLDLVRQGILDEETLVFDEKEGRWRKTREITYLAPEAVAGAPERTLETTEAENVPQIAAAPENNADQIAHEHPESPFETVQGTEGSPASQVVSAAEHGTLWRRWTDWLQDDGTCFRVGMAILVLCGLMFCLLIAGSANPDAAETFGAKTLGRLLIAGVVMFFFLKRGLGLGKGRAILVLSALLFCFFGYLVQVLVVSLANNGKTTNIMVSTLIDIQRRAQGFSGEVALLNIDSVFEMLDGKRACKRADLVEMRERIGSAERKTNEFIAFFASRVSQAKNEISSIDPSASASFMSDVNKSFPELQKALSLQREYYQDVDGLLAFLLEQSGPYQVTGEGVRFSKEPDRSLYNTRIDRINQLAASSNSRKAEHQAVQSRP